jgi:hypothetical protein
VGYRAEWLTHAGAVAKHNEVLLHAIDREMPDGDLRVLVAGVGNGGAVEVWQRMGADVIGVDKNPACAALGLPVEICDVMDEGSVRGALHGRVFDLIVDCTRAGSPWLWPFLRSGGRLLLEDLPEGLADDMTQALYRDRVTWLPIEEIMRVSVFPRVIAVEKRNPRVVPYLDVVAGNFADITGEQALIESGARWVVT